MPILFRKHHLQCVVAVWQITESITELLEILPHANIYKQQIIALKNDQRKKEFLAVRLLLQALLPNSPLIDYATDGKPFLVSSPNFISISHTKGYAAICLSQMGEVGIDIELATDRIHGIAERFMNKREYDFYLQQPSFALLAWATKEAIFKKIGVEVVDFAQSIHVNVCSPLSEGNVNVVIKSNKQPITMNYQYNENFVLVYG